MNDTTSYKVICPIETRPGKTRWLRIGRAYKNRDGSTNVYLDALPSNSKLQIREWDERDDFKSRDQDAAPLTTAGDMPF